MDILILVQSATSQGVVWALLAIGVFITFRILDIADLTAEGSFPLGAGIAAISITNGYSPWIATLLGFFGGVLAGLVSGLLHTKYPCFVSRNYYNDWLIFCHFTCNASS
jgi:putative ABC transport system permease protein